MRGAGDQNAIPGLINPVHGQQDLLRTGGGGENGSNGVLNDQQLDWLLEWFDSVTISFDGTEELQNRQRPMADGSASFPLVHRTLKRLNDAGKQFSIRSTLTASSVEKLPR